PRVLSREVGRRGSTDRRHSRKHGEDPHVLRAQKAGRAAQGGRARKRMAMIMASKEPQRHDIEALLPGHAAGTLSRRDADRVDQALAGDRELARRYELVREELAETIHLNETLGAPSARAMEKLFAAIDAEEARAPRRRRSLDLGARIAEFLSG